MSLKSHVFILQPNLIYILSQLSHRWPNCQINSGKSQQLKPWHHDVTSTMDYVTGSAGLLFWSMKGCKIKTYFKIYNVKKEYTVTLHTLIYYKHLLLMIKALILDYISVNNWTNFCFNSMVCCTESSSQWKVLCT